MSDPSFDDLLESLDAIQAEHAQRRDSSSSSSSSSSSDSDNDKKNKQKKGHFEINFNNNNDNDNDNDNHASIQLNFELPPPPPPIQEHHHHHHHHNDDNDSNYGNDNDNHYSSFSSPSHQVVHDHAPAPTFSAPVHNTNHAATPSRSGDVKQYQRQSIIQPKQAQRGSDTHCAKCNNSLYGTEYVTAGGRSYHQDHFTCAKCSKRLVGAYYDHHSQVYCPGCAGDLMPCTKCQRGITGQYMILEGRPFHNECVERKQCAQCYGAIEDTVLTALGKTWHTRCFKCIQCSKELGREFIQKDGNPQCVNCAERARPQCEKCRGPLSGEFINFQGQSYHQDCFVCAQCRSRLGTSGFFNVQGQLKCQRCVK